MKNILPDIVRIEDALKFISHVEECYSANMDQKELMAACYGIMVVGEALNHVSDEIRNQFPDVKWRKIIDTRNRLIHGYGMVDKQIMANIADTHLPELKHQLVHILKHIKSGINP